MEKKKVVLKLDLDDNKAKQKAMKTVSFLPGIESIAIDTKEKKLTVIGDVDPVEVVSKLRKLWRTDILTVGPAKEPGKKKEENNKETKIKDDDKIKTEEKQIKELRRYYPNYNAYMNQNQNQHPNPNQYYYGQSAEENPNSCVIT